MTIFKVCSTIIPLRLPSKVDFRAKPISYSELAYKITQNEKAFNEKKILSKKSMGYPPANFLSHIQLVAFYSKLVGKEEQQHYGPA